MRSLYEVALGDLNEAQNRTTDFDDSSLSSPRSETSSLGGDVPGSYEELKVAYRKLRVECRDQKREIHDISVRLEEADSVNASLKQHLKNLETGYQGQVDQLGSKVSQIRPIEWEIKIAMGYICHCWRVRKH